MDIKRTCFCAVTVVTACFTIPLGMQLYSAHSERINGIAAFAADLTVGEYGTERIGPETEKTEPEEKPAAEEVQSDLVTVSRKTLWDIDMAPQETQPVIQSREVPTAKPSREMLDKVKYPESLENHDGVIQNYTYPHYTGAQYIDLKDGGQVRNCTDVPNSTLVSESTKELPFKLDKNSDKPQVLIYHTHTTESFEPYARDFYDSSFYSKTTDMTKNIVSVGDNICKQLDAAGVTYVHDTLVHDYPSYNEAYASSRKTVQEILKKYPSIKIVLDVHRDGIQREDGTRIAPVVQIGGRQAAQIMIISGCDDGTMGMPNYLLNFRLASRLQSQIESDWNGLTRPVLFDYRHYNQDLTTGSLLIEVGSHGNSIDQAQYSGELIGKSIAKLFETGK